MNVKKAAEAVGSGVPNGVQLDAINALAKGTMTAEQVYVFSVKICDDQVDRDGERFDTAALPELARLFIGKTGIMDHCWSAERQIARIFETQVVKENGISYIKAWAYIRRGEDNDGGIADIEAGIKKEVSVGCAMGRAVCSICGSDYGSCGHRNGEAYDGMTCCASLMEPMDAYEFSFVAVPAQRDAGVMKALGSARRSLKELADAYGAQGEYRDPVLTTYLISSSVTTPVSCTLDVFSRSCGLCPKRRRNSCRSDLPSLSTSSRIHGGITRITSCHWHLICITPAQDYEQDWRIYKKDTDSFHCRYPKS